MFLTQIFASCSSLDSGATYSQMEDSGQKHFLGPWHEILSTTQTETHRFPENCQDLEDFFFEGRWEWVKAVSNGLLIHLQLMMLLANHTNSPTSPPERCACAYSDKEDC